ncbi:unnamed protein product [Adineta steineri]|uniref:Uncharacterized protein n=1 Tax=Adineta steineri TaxID=433720 RepID=A0A815GX55_9BILA|nr:unnamed protein product [Adineta steineri]CAF1594032.1 unnamed protein product [Adineta steineri]
MSSKMWTNKTSETVPLTPANEPSSHSRVASLGRKFGTTYFIISVIILSCIPIIELVIGLYYKGECPINQLIATYMIGIGICGLILVALSLFLSITYVCFIPDSASLTLMASCGVCLNVIATIIISIIVFIWFILGCIWVFSNASRVQFHDPLKNTYCDPFLYKSTFILLIITIIWALIQGCISCCRACWTSESD